MWTGGRGPWGDDDAVNKFIYEKRWMEFSELKEVMACVTAGVRIIIICDVYTIVLSSSFQLLSTLPSLTRQQRQIYGGS